MISLLPIYGWQHCRSRLHLPKVVQNNCIPNFGILSVDFFSDFRGVISPNERRGGVLVTHGKKMDSNVSLNLIRNWKSLCDDIVFAEVAPVLLQNGIITVEEYEEVTSQSEPYKMECFLLLLLRKSEATMVKFGECLQQDYSCLADMIRNVCVEEMQQDEGTDEIDAMPVRADVTHRFENETPTEDVCMEYMNLNTIHSNTLNNRVKVKRRRGMPKSRIKNRLRPKIQNSEPVLMQTEELIKPTLNEEVTHEVIKTMKNCSLLSRNWTTIAHALGLTDRVHDIRFKVIHHGEDLNMCIVYLVQHWRETAPKAATLSNLIEVLRGENFNGVADQLTDILYRKPS